MPFSKGVSLGTQTTLKGPLHICYGFQFCVNVCQCVCVCVFLVFFSWAFSSVCVCPVLICYCYFILTIP
ncbi:mCG1031405 [Mus musculus]|nr:mCG1031405 [Mus musculus]